METTIVTHWTIKYNQTMFAEVIQCVSQLPENRAKREGAIVLTVIIAHKQQAQGSASLTSSENVYCELPEEHLSLPISTESLN